MSSPTPSSERKPRGETREELKKIGKYQITRKLGAGGMGTVYLATDSELKRTVALKVLPQDRANNPTLVRRFKSEGQAAALLQHKNIVSVFEAGQADGYLFLALEYVDGIDLLEWVNRRGPIPVKRTVEIIRQSAEALQHAYERNIVHRDIKPSNLMVSKEGTVKLTDMGLARSIDDTLDTTITRDGTTVGTVDYMAPEQASNSKAADIRSDLYSLGCTWYHLLTGSPPFPEGSVTNKISAHISGPLPDPRILNPKVPEAVVAVIHRMMAKKKEQRYQTPAELLEDLNSSTLRRTQNSPDLLAMFGDDTAQHDSDDKLNTPTRTGRSSTDFTVADKKKGTPAPPSKPVKGPPARSQATREMPVSGVPNDPRALLVRMAVELDGTTVTRRRLPWGLMVLGVLGLIAVITVAVLAKKYSVPPEKTEPGASPYAVGPDPNEEKPIEEKKEPAASTTPAVDAPK
ncbi:serine/threonine protein kinase [Planctomicrobium piriforme]|uniref:non-specific serine/threonine protein kinase n=1 Tax=Planctomicrobium piriforme TaxID=1576369 RepID=A0A1I3QVN3_9PLAN|nr:serine/threonine-protein kinase [Planctomicrobium piriforme]SFJ38128.1 serine/threonine protein kinase [Planctomicrobium piriforme]